MGAVTFSIDPRLVQCLKEALPLSTFVESGTFKGDAVAAVSAMVERSITIEASEPLWREARERFATTPNVQVLHGDSATVLKSVAPGLRTASTLYWLDAHWCVAEGTAGEHSQCPLLAEIDAIEVLNAESVVLVDDARLFLARPPEPHDVSDWPTFDQVVRSLRRLSPTHELAVVNDVIAFYPPAARGCIDSFSRKVGVDWLRAIQSLEENSALRSELDAREVVIRTLSSEHERSEPMRAELVEKEAVIQGLLKKGRRTVATDGRLEEVQEELRILKVSSKEKEEKIQSQNKSIMRMHEEHASLAKSLGEKEVVLQALLTSIAHAEQQQQELLRSAQQTELAKRDVAALTNPQVHAILARELEEKEAVIQELKKALDSYRAAFGLLGYVLRPITRLIPLSVFSRMIPRPRLGTLYQHGPQELVIPRSYAKAPALASAPRISLVTPSFKQSAFIERTLRSVLDQNYPNLEYHVQDGGSEDGTREILERYAPRLASWESRPDSGQSEAINLGFARVTGDIMGWLNSDDILLPGALHKVAEFFNRNPEVDVIYGHRLLIDENDRLIGRWILPAHNDRILSWADYVPQETLFWRRRIWEKAGGRIDPSFRFAMDWDLLLRFREAGARFARIGRFMGGFRIHPHQKTSAAIGEIGFKEMDRLRERSLGRVPTHSEVRRAVMPYLLRHLACELGWRIRTKLGGHR